MSLGSNVRWWVTNQFIPFFRGPDPQHVRQRNIWHLYQDLLWLGLATAASTYTSVYAIRLGASEKLLGLRTALPSLFVVLLRIPAARWTERSSDRKSLIVHSLLGGRVLYLLLVFLPWLGNLPLLKQIPPATLLVGLLIAMSLPGVLSQAGWDTFFAEVVPPQRRARVVSMRNTMTYIITLVVVPLMGTFLDWAAFPGNYQILFVVAFVGAMMSTWHVNRISVASPPLVREKSNGLSLSEARGILRDAPDFATLVLATFVYQWGISTASPYFNVYYVDTLGASDSWIGWQTTLASICSIAAFRLWPRMLERYGERRILKLTTPMMMLYPLLTGLTRTLTPNLFIIMIPRFFGSAVMLSRYNLLLQACPANRRPTYIGIYAILNNIAAFAAPLVGAAMVDLIGLSGVFFVAAALRLGAALLYLRLPKPVPAPVSEGSTT